MFFTSGLNVRGDFSKTGKAIGATPEKADVVCMEHSWTRIQNMENFAVLPKRRGATAVVRTHCLQG